MTHRGRKGKRTKSELKQHKAGKGNPRRKKKNKEMRTNQKPESTEQRPADRGTGTGDTDKPSQSEGRREA